VITSVQRRQRMRIISFNSDADVSRMMRDQRLETGAKALIIQRPLLVEALRRDATKRALDGFIVSVSEKPSEMAIYLSLILPYAPCRCN